MDGAEALSAARALQALSCPVCLMPLHHVPLCLPCGHMLCARCLVHLESGTCPCCRQPASRSPWAHPSPLAVREAASLLGQEGGGTPSNDPLARDDRCDARELWEFPSPPDVGQLACARFLALRFRPALEALLERCEREAAAGSAYFVEASDSLVEPLLPYLGAVREAILNRGAADVWGSEELQAIVVTLFEHENWQGLQEVRARFGSSLGPVRPSFLSRLARGAPPLTLRACLGLLCALLWGVVISTEISRAARRDS